MADREHLQNLFLDAARLLMLCGAVGVVDIAGSPGDGSATQAFTCLFVWLLGVCFMSLVPAAGRFPRVALVAAAVAQAFVKHLFTLWN